MSSPRDIHIGTEENFKVGGSNLELRTLPENLPGGKNLSAAGPGYFHKVTTCSALFRIVGKQGVGKTSSLSDLIKTLPPIVFLPLDSDDDTPEPEVRS